MARPAWRCLDCGFAPSTVGPGDAQVAVRSYHRRWRALLVRPDDPDPDIVHRRTEPGSPSAIDHAAASAAGMARAAVALERLHAVHDAEVDPGPPAQEVVAMGAAGDRTLDQVLDDVAAGADAVGAAMRRFHGEAWADTGHLPAGDPVDVLDLARSGVHAGAHHLRAAERVLSEVRFLRS